MSVNTNSINAPLPLGASHGGLGVASPTAHGILVAEGSSAAVSKVLTNGQLLVGSTGADPVAATLTVANMVMATGAGSITLAPLNWVTNVSASTTTCNTNTGYTTDSGNTTTITFNVPAAATVGDVLIIISQATSGSGLVTINGNGNRVARVQGINTGAAINFLDNYASATLICTASYSNPGTFGQWQLVSYNGSYN